MQREWTVHLFTDQLRNAVMYSWLQALLALWSYSSLPPQSATSPGASSGLTPSLLAYDLYKCVHVYTISNAVCMFHCSFWIAFAFARISVTCVCVCPWVCDTEIRGNPSCWCLSSNSFEMGPLIVHQWICPASWPVNMQGLPLPASHVCNSWMASLCTDFTWLWKCWAQVFTIAQ